MPNTPGVATYLATVYNTAGASKSVSSTSWNLGDVLVVISGQENVATGVGVPTNTGSGLAWTSLVNNTTAGTCGTRISIAQATASSSGVVSCTGDVTAHWGFSLFVINGGKTGGTTAEQHTATKTVALVPKAANSLILWGCFDFNVEGAVTSNPTNPPVVTRESATDAAHYSWGVFSMMNQTSPASVSYGGVFGAATGPYSLVVVEVPGVGISQRSKGGRLQPAPFKPGHYHNAKYHIKD